MREQFWKLLESAYRTERYYWYYRQRANFLNNLVQVVLLASAMSGVAGLWIWNIIPEVWAFVAMVTQLLSAAAYLLPQSNQIRALDYLLPELQLLLNRIEHDWNSIDLPGVPSDAEINDLILRYNNELTALENKYTGGISFSVCRRAEELAEADCKKYKFVQYNVEQFDVIEEVLNNADKQCQAH